MQRLSKTRLHLTLLLAIPLLSAFSTPLRAQEITPVVVYDLDATEDGSYYSLRENRIVPAAEVTEDNWDLKFQGTTISVNGQAQLLERAFDLIQRAPEAGYKADDPATGPAIPSANRAGWYEYDENSHMVMPFPDRTIALITKGNAYAKVEILSYYEGQMPDAGSPRFYTFRFVLQPDGSRDFR